MATAAVSFFTLMTCVVAAAYYCALAVCGKTYVMVLMAFVSSAFYCQFSTSMADPGFVSSKWKPDDAQDLQRLSECLECSRYKPPRSHHCSRCRKCVHRMDHHCDFIGNCVGQNNHGVFLACVAFTIVSLILGLNAVSLKLWIMAGQRHSLSVPYAILTLVEILLIYSGSALITLSWEQLKGSWYNTTCIERLKMARERHLGLKETNPYDRGVVLNLGEITGCSATAAIIDNLLLSRPARKVLTKLKGKDDRKRLQRSTTASAMTRNSGCKTRISSKGQEKCGPKHVLSVKDCQREDVMLQRRKGHWLYGQLRHEHDRQGRLPRSSLVDGSSPD